MHAVVVYDQNGRTHRIVRTGKAGGEGELCLVEGDRSRCAKIYHESRRGGDAEAKIRAMVANPPTDPTFDRTGSHRSIAWPLEVLFGDASLRRFLGFTMPFIDMKEYREAQHFFSREDRIRDYAGGFTWRHQLATAFNITSALAALHEKGHRVGDLRETNILVSPRSTITFIDCDSFQVATPKGGRTFHCRVGTGEWLPPELIGRSFAKEDIDRYHSDLFALGVMIFRFLMQGVHPFQARGKGVEDAPTPEAKICKGKFPYGSVFRDVEPPKFAPPWDFIPPPIQRLFEKCFVDGHKAPDKRPGAKEWFVVLGREVADLAKCDARSTHHFGSHLASCPWCGLAARGGPDLYPEPLGQQVLLTSAAVNAQVDQKTREQFLLSLISMALADGDVSVDERQVILDRATQLGIPSTRALEILDEEETRNRSRGRPGPSLATSWSSVRLKRAILPVLVVVTLGTSGFLAYQQRAILLSLLHDALRVFVSDSTAPKTKKATRDRKMEDKRDAASETTSRLPVAAVPAPASLSFQPDHSPELEPAPVGSSSSLSTGIISTNGPRANVRSGPGKDEKVLFKLKEGEPVSILGRRDDWLQIRDRRGEVGWVYSMLVESGAER